MKNMVYVVRDGTIERGAGTIRLCDPLGQSRYIPIENTEAILLAGTVALTAGAATLLAKEGIHVVWLNWRDQECASLQSLLDHPNGQLVLAQALAVNNPRRRLALAKEILAGAAANMRTVLRYYRNRGVGVSLDGIDPEPKGENIDSLMGWEGLNRRFYYEQLDAVLPEGMKIGERIYRPPSNEINALISFLNGLTYTLCHVAISSVGLCPALSFLHAVSGRRNSLALDLSEVFKPLLADRVLLALVKQGRIKGADFEELRLTKEGRQKVLQTWDEKLNESQMHRRLNRNVTWREMVKLEAAKLAKDLLGVEPYASFRANQ